MATKTVVCPACGNQTTLGRYTCIECGAFLTGFAVQRPPDPEPAVEPEAILDPVEPDRPAVSAASTEPAESPEPVARFGAPEPDETPVPRFGAPEPADEAWDEPWDGPAARFGAAEPPEPLEPTAAPPSDRAADVQWPAAGTMPPLPAPEPRVPAGSWLPPSALLTGLEEPPPGPGVAAAAAALPARPSSSMPRDWLDALGSPASRWDAARRTIAIGSVVALFGFVLPWGSGSLGNLLTVWLNVWGLAFPGMWLIALALLGLTALSALSGRVETLPLGLPAIVLASLQLGLIWSTLFGAANRPIGILVVLVGAIVLAVGGGLQLGARHEAATPDV